MSKYFKLSELTYSATARKYGIDNTPTEEHKKNLEELMLFLDEIRYGWGNAVIVTSGYRCIELNEKVGGSKTSVHPLGWAADIKPANNKMKEFIEFIIDWSKDKKFDQIIIERGSKGSVWVHVGLYNSKGKQRRQVKSLEA